MMKTEEELRRQQIDELWRYYVHPTVDAGVGQEERQIEALRLIRSFRDRAEDAIDDERVYILSQALAILQLLVADLFEWVPTLIDDIENLHNAEDERKRVLVAGSYTDKALNPLFLNDLHAVALILPRSTFEIMRKALQALEHGEVQSLLKYDPNARRGASWTWDQARILAVEHVLFLTGQGVSKIKARERVAKATKCVNVGTLQKWEERDLKRYSPESNFALAKQAGVFQRMLDDDPDIWTSEKSADAEVVHKMRLLKGQLSAFGRAYEQDFGDRYRSKP